MPVLTDAQWSKFEAAIAAVKLRGARPRKEDRRTIEAIIWRLDNGAKWRSIPAEPEDWHHASQRFHWPRAPTPWSRPPGWGPKGTAASPGMPLVNSSTLSWCRSGRMSLLPRC